MAKRLEELDYYGLLSIDRGASVDAIKDAFHKFARKYHPDRFAGDPKAVSRNTRIYRRGTEAYRVLIQHERRRAYDAGLEQGRLRYDPQDVPPAAGGARALSLAPPKASARPFVAKAKLAFKQGDFSQAKLQIKVAMARDPDNETLRRMLADVEARIAERR